MHQPDYRPLSFIKVMKQSKRLTLTRNGKLRLTIANEYLAALEKRLAKSCSSKQLSALRDLEIQTPCS
jgi:hypothetical protein